MRTLRNYCEHYESSEGANDQIWTEFTSLTDSVPYLKEHRDWVEKSNWGFGDRAFHYLWYLLLKEEIFRRTTPSLLEIGVYKGQIISLWSLIAAREGCGAEVYAISPFRGNPRFRYFFHQTMRLLSRKYREDIRSGNRYPREDYLRCVQGIYQEFDLDIGRIHLLQGLSADSSVKAQVSDLSFDLVYVDGGHTYDEVAHDISFYGEMVTPNGYLVLDDASYFEPGTKFFKGHQSVSRVANEIDKDKFANVINVGHNRVFKRIA